MAWLYGGCTLCRAQGQEEGDVDSEDERRQVQPQVPAALHADGLTAACREPLSGTAAVSSFCRQKVSVQE